MTKAQRLKTQKRYDLSEKGKARHKRYNASAKGIATRERYDSTEKGKARYTRHYRRLQERFAGWGSPSRVKEDLPLLKLIEALAQGNYEVVEVKSTRWGIFRQHLKFWLRYGLPLKLHLKKPAPDLWGHEDEW